MIKLAASTAFMLYLAVTLAVLLGIWAWSHIKSRKNRAFPPQQAVRTCEYCQYNYLDDVLKSVSQCPQCRSFNKGNQYQALDL